MKIPRIQTEEKSIDAITSLLLTQGIEAHIDIANWKEFAYKPKATAYLAHDGERLWCRFDVEENHIHVATTADHGPVWEDSCVELFVADADGKHYFNFETNAAGAMLASRRLSREEFTRLDDGQMSEIVRMSSLPRRKAELRGQESKPWTVTIAIPLKIIGYNEVPDAVKLNLYKCGDKTDTPHFLSFAPIDTPSPDFHRPEFFTELTLEK